MPKIAIPLPQFGEAAAEATVQSWLCQVGEPIEQDQEILEVETEKSILTVTAPSAGTLLEILKPEGSRCQVNDILGWLQSDAETGNDAPAPLAEAPPPASAAAALQTVSHRDGSRYGFLSPRLRALMQEEGLTELDLYLLRGSGHAGRIKADDLAHFLARLKQDYDPHPVGILRKAVADGMERSWSRPLATVSSMVKMDALLAHRKTLAERPSASIYALSALAKTLKEDGRIAELLFGERLWQSKCIDIALAIDVQDGIYNPVIKAVDGHSLNSLSLLVHSLIEQAHARQLSAESQSAGIATVSNYGSLGITWATPLPPPGHSCLLGLGAIRRQPDWDAASKTWKCIRGCEITLTFDHRIADGSTAARLVHRIVHLLEHPELLS